MAYDPKNDLVSAINLKATGLMMKKTTSGMGAGDNGSSQREFSIPFGDGVSTYIDCSAPGRPDTAARDTARAFRTVLGFHIMLK